VIETGCERCPASHETYYGRGSMIHYAAIAGRPDAVDGLRHRLASSLFDRRVFEGERSEASDPALCWTVAALHCADPLASNRLTVDNRSFGVINGPVLCPTVENGNVAARLLTKFAAGGTDAVSGEVSGGWNFAGATPQLGLRAFGDFSGQYPLYFGSVSGATVVSNRSGVVSDLVRGGGWDLHAMSWLVGQSLRGDRMPASGARYLRPGQEIRVSLEDGSYNLIRSPEWIWADPQTVELRDNLTSTEWDDVTEALVSNFAALQMLPNLPYLRLSGGKDSRLSLALLKAAGLTDGLVTATTGTDESPEVECAAEVARIAGVEHRRIGPPVAVGSAPPAFDPGAVWRRLRQHTYRYEGAVSQWDGMNDRLGLTTVHITGFGGELYKRGSDGRLVNPDISTREMFATACGRGLDAHGIRRPMIVDYQSALIDDWISESLDETHFGSLAERWYVDYRLGHWNGPLAQSKAGHITLAPLALRLAVAKQMELTPRARASQRLIFEVMIRVSPELAALGFMNDTWSDELIASSPIPVATQPFPATHKPSPSTMLPWQHRFVEHEANEIKQLLDEADHETDIGLILDVSRVKAAVDSVASLTTPELRQIISTVGVASALLGRAEQVIDGV
jgi:hypothetical protein